ncbi:hypothetical protein [Nocardiopsis valliformis]|nr:hypothetical protein [Nocardiopsis valliformis]
MNLLEEDYEEAPELLSVAAPSGPDGRGPRLVMVSLLPFQILTLRLER